LFYTQLIIISIIQVFAVLSFTSVERFAILSWYHSNKKYISKDFFLEANVVVPGL